LTGWTPFRLIYGKETVIPMEFIFPSLDIATITKLSNTSAIEERLAYLVHIDLEEMLVIYSK
jgi:hypothetical protein